MKNVADYLVHIKALIVVSPQIVHWTIVREESVDDIGLLRYKVVLQDGAFAEMFARFRIVAGQANVSKYSFHDTEDTEAKPVKPPCYFACAQNKPPRLRSEILKEPGREV